MRQIIRRYAAKRGLVAALAALVAVAGIAVLVVSGNESAHTLEIRYEDFLAVAEQGPDAIEFAEYSFVLPASVTVHMEDGAEVSRESGQAQIAAYRLDSRIAGLMGELEFPLESAVLQQQTLEALEDKVLISFFDCGLEEERGAVGMMIWIGSMR